MAANNAKPLAFHYPMKSSELDFYWTVFLHLADEHNEVI